MTTQKVEIQFYDEESEKDYYIVGDYDPGSSGDHITPGYAPEISRWKAYEETGVKEVSIPKHLHEKIENLLLEAAQNE